MTGECAITKSAGLQAAVAVTTARPVTMATSTWHVRVFLSFFFFFNGGAIERNGERMLEKERKEDFVYYALMESQKQRGKSVFICLSC